MVELLWCIIWAAVCYYYAKDAREQYPTLDIDPTLYIVGGLLFGVFSLLWCMHKKSTYKKYNK